MTHLFMPRSGDYSELDMAWKTMAQADREKGALESKKETLLFQLRFRFKEIPAETVTLIESTKNPKRFEEWFAAVLTAETLEDVGVTPTK